MCWCRGVAVLHTVYAGVVLSSGLGRPLVYFVLLALDSFNWMSLVHATAPERCLSCDADSGEPAEWAAQEHCKAVFSASVFRYEF